MVTHFPSSCPIVSLNLWRTLASVTNVIVKKYFHTGKFACLWKCCLLAITSWISIEAFFLRLYHFFATWLDLVGPSIWKCYFQCVCMEHTHPSFHIHTFAHYIQSRVISYLILAPVFSCVYCVCIWLIPRKSFFLAKNFLLASLFCFLSRFLSENNIHVVDWIRNETCSAQPKLESDVASCDNEISFTNTQPPVFLHMGYSIILTLQQTTLLTMSASFWIKYCCTLSIYWCITCKPAYNWVYIVAYWKDKWNCNHY